MAIAKKSLCQQQQPQYFVLVFHDYISFRLRILPLRAQSITGNSLSWNIIGGYDRLTAFIFFSEVFNLVHEDLPHLERSFEFWMLSTAARSCHLWSKPKLDHLPYTSRPPGVPDHSVQHSFCSCCLYYLYVLLHSIIAILSPTGVLSLVLPSRIEHLQHSATSTINAFIGMISILLLCIVFSASFTDSDRGALTRLS